MCLPFLIGAIRLVSITEPLSVLSSRQLPQLFRNSLGEPAGGESIVAAV
jgi:hypothetical protein